MDELSEVRMDRRLHISRVPGSRRYLADAVSQIGQSSAWLLLTRLVIQAQSLLSTVLLAHYLGQSGFGTYSLIASLVFLANVLTTFGTDTLLIRRVAVTQRVDLPEIGTVLELQLAFSSLVIATIFWWTRAASHQPVGFTTALRLYALSLWPLSIFSVLSAILRGLERMDLYLVASLGTGSLQILGIWLALRTGIDLPGLMGVLLSVQVFAMLLCYALCRAAAPSFKFSRPQNWRPTAWLLRAAWPLALLSVASVAYQRLGIYTLSYWGDPGQAGLFSAAVRAVEALKLGHIAVLGALLPALTRLQRGLVSGPDEKALGARIFRLSTLVLFGIGLLGAAGLSFMASPLVSLVFGPDFAGAAPVLLVLGWILLPYSLSAPLTIELIARDREKAVTLALLAGLGAALVSSVVWVPARGASGAGLAALAGECVQLGGLCFFEKRG
jgi:O-antigen/teichoic acid export membrane protein